MIATFTGTRNGMSALQIRFLTAVLESGLIEVLVHGMCKGADTQADHIAKRFGIYRIGYPADDSVSTHSREHLDCDEIMDPSPPLDRNRVMIDRAGILIAGPQQTKEILRSGTWAAIRYARKQDKPILLLPR